MSGSPPRMMILKLEVENFKSYGGVKEIGPFHKSFSSVVGPNGSGKSNVIDCMLFVFGKKSSKLRLNKLSELIHKSAEYPTLDSGRVTVYFQDILDVEGDPDAYSVVPSSQFTVTRTVFRDNTSKYYVNGKGSSFTEVTALLKGKGIDLDNNRFLILQGEVELISQMKPKAPSPHEEGLLEYLEDIIGSSVYVERIAEAGKVVEELSEKRVEALKRVQVAEKDKGALEGAKAEAEALLAVERGVLRQGHLIAQKVCATTEEALGVAEGVAAAAVAAAGVAAGEYRATLEAAKVCEASEVEATAAREAAAEVCEGRRKAMDGLSERDATLRVNIGAARLTLTKGGEAVKREGERVEEGRRALAAAAGALPGVEARVASLTRTVEEEVERKAGVMASLRGETEALRGEMEAAQAHLDPLADAAATAAGEASKLTTTLALLEARLAAGATAVATAQGRAGGVRDKLAGVVEEEGGVSREVGAGRARVGVLEGKVGECEREERVVAGVLAGERVKLEEGKAGLESARVAAVGDGALGKLMAACAPGGALEGCGLHGRLGDLGTIDASLDTAVTMASGGSLGCYVVDTTEGARRCMDYLREHSLGRARMMVLEKIAKVPASLPPVPGGAVCRLYEAITPSHPRFAPAFWFATGATLVAKDIHVAKELAFKGEKRVRVVTLGGDICEDSGAMSGGGGKARKGAMRLTGSPPSASTSAAAAAAARQQQQQQPSLSPAAIEALEREVARLTSQLSTLKSTRAAAAAELKALTASLPKLQARLAKLGVERASLTAMLEDLEAQVVAAQVQAAGAASGSSSSGSGGAADEAERAGLVRECKAAGERASVTAAAAAKQQSLVQSLQRRLVESGGERVASVEARLARAREGLEAASKECVKLKGVVKSSEKSVEKALAAGAAAAAEVAKAGEEEKRLRYELTALEEEALVVHEGLEAAKLALRSREGALGEARGAAAAAGAKVKCAKVAKVAAEGAAEAAKGDCAKGREAVGAWKARVERLAGEYEEHMEEVCGDLECGLRETGVIGGEGEEGGGTGVGAGASSGGGGRLTPHPAVLAALSEPLTLPTLSPEELGALSREKLEAVLAGLQGEKKALTGKVNVAAIKEFRAKEKEYLLRVAHLTGISEARECARRKYEEDRKARLDAFMAGFSTITLRLKEMYQMITLGGDAELELVDSLDPFSEGIVFSVRPPKKSWKNISNLSGGEKTLSSLALVFALHHYKPTPLYVMDEIDAALDFKNVSIVANYIKERTRNAQFIIISLRNNMFELADRLVGIYKTKDVTKSVTINPKAIANACGMMSAEDTMSLPNAGGGLMGGGGGGGGGGGSGL